jgi:hypothetical protein
MQILEQQIVDHETQIELTAEQKAQFEEFKTLNDKVKN